MEQEVKTKSTPEIGCIWTYFGVSLECFWSVSEYLLMRADVRWRTLMSADDSGVSPTNGRCTPGLIDFCFFLPYVLLCSTPEFVFYKLRRFCNRFINFFRLLAACLSQFGLSAASAVNNRGYLFNDVACL